MTKKWVFLVVLGLGLLLGLGLWWRLPKVNVVNQLSFKQFHLSTVSTHLYLWKSGYWPQVKRLSVTYAAERQKGYSLKGGDGAEIVSMWMENQQGDVNVYIHYNQQTYAEIADNPGWVDRDVYAGICLALESKILGWQGCRQKASEYYQWTQQNRLPGIIKALKGLFGFQFVKPAYAACYGTIICGKEEWTCTCSGGANDKKTCADNDDCPGGTCGCLFECNTDPGAGNDLSCYENINDEYNCNNNSTPANCFVGCNPDPQSYCSWSDAGALPPPPEPEPPPSCTPDGVSTVGLDCDRIGLYGIKREQGRITEEKYTCGPNATQPASSCNWWNGDWSGYFIAPETGWYQFLIKAYPNAGMSIDLNQDGVLPTSRTVNRRGEGILAVDQQNCSDRYRPLWLRTFWNSTDPYPASGETGLNCYTTRDCSTSPDPECDPNPFCDQGVHCQKVDFNYSTTTYPVTKTLLPTPYTGLTPIYPWTPTHSTPQYATTTDSEVIMDAAPNYSISPLAVTPSP